MSKDWTPPPGQTGRVCIHCAGWGKWSVPSIHELYGKTCAPCGGTGNELNAEETALRWQLHSLETNRKCGFR